MAKPKSEGFPYCQQDTDTFFDPKIRTLISRFGCDGYAVWDYIKQAAYREHGYYVEWDEDRQELAAADLYISVEKLGMIVAYLLKRSLLLSKSFNGITVLTSHGIQVRFQKMAKDTKRSYIFRKDIWVLSEEETLRLVFYTPQKNNSGINPDNSGIKGNNSGIIRQKNSKEKNNIPPISPKGGEGDEETRERFFAAYPKLKGLAKYKGINYAALYRQFEKSEFLRTRFSVNWVFENYGDIIVGAYADIPNGEEYMRAREAWYTARRDAAQALAEQNRKRAEQSAAFCEAERACKSAEISIAKAEAHGAADEAADAVKARENAVRVLKRELKNIGLTEKNLLPQWHCKKCSDTGFLPDGRACDCYEEKERC